jgi:uncharacterized protein YnzC (UPF0291/DUF896 family)
VENIVFRQKERINSVKKKQRNKGLTFKECKAAMADW